MRNPSFYMTLITLATALAVSLPALATQPAREQNMQRHLQNMEQRLHLSSRQSIALREAMRAQRETHRQIASKYGLQRGAGTPRQQLTPAQRGEYRNEMRNARENFENRVGGILDEQQLQEWQKIREETRQQAQQRREARLADAPAPGGDERE